MPAHSRAHRGRWWLLGATVTVAMAWFAAPSGVGASGAASSAGKPTIVLEHGAWADATFVRRSDAGHAVRRDRRTGVLAPKVQGAGPKGWPPLYTQARAIQSTWPLALPARFRWFRLGACAPWTAPRSAGASYGRYYGRFGIPVFSRIVCRSVGSTGKPSASARRACSAARA